ncbi:hypothetical protein G7054_g13374 [Neopestalotiopsis clavispora]|nr:hypothetical protein G7054_g13374 [Neopestalotiopsis clavispora]
MSHEIPDVGLASSVAVDVEKDGNTPGALTEATSAEQQQDRISTTLPYQPSDTIERGEEVKFVDSNVNVDDERQLQVQPQKLDVAVAMPSHPNWNPEASLYCPQIGQQHSVLVDFGYSSCPKCKQTLLKKKRISDTPASSSHGDENTSDQHRNADDHSGQPDASPEDTTTEAQDTNISYVVEYRDAGNYQIISEPWSGPFDLVSARKGAGEKKTSIFDVVTILKTTLRADPDRSESEIGGIIFDGILENPSIGVIVDGSKMVIHSPDIIKELASVASYYPSINFASETIEMREPYPLIAHHFDGLEDLAARNETAQSLTPDDIVKASQIDDTSGEGPEIRKTDLRLLLDFMTSVYKDDIKNERERHNRQSCTFRMLWLLFKPGETVYCQDKGRLAAYVVQEIEKIRPDPTDFRQDPSDSIGKEVYKIGLWNLGFDGQFVGRCTRTVTITRFEGERSIMTLKAFPCHFFDMHDDGKYRQELEADGKQWYELLTGRQVQYSGKLLDDPNKDCYGRVYIDTKSYYAQNPEATPKISKIEDMGQGLALCQCEECLGCRPHPPSGFRWSTYDVIDPRKVKSLETNSGPEPRKHRYLLCPRELHGLILKTRTWECIAEYTGRALLRLSLTGGDLGTDEQSVERALNRWFTLAEAWGAVMLIDEADVYLERRQITDLKRNIMVSVFLRSIEYYRGILFLTTNRVGQLDDAFISRIHVVIACEEFGIPERMTIWKQFFEKLSRDRQDITITKRAKTLNDYEYSLMPPYLAFQTAVALADYRAQRDGKADEPVLDQSDFENVLNLSADFKQYLKRIDGVDENTRAFRAKNRALAAHDSSKES